MFRQVDTSKLNTTGFYTCPRCGHICITGEACWCEGKPDEIECNICGGIISIDEAKQCDCCCEAVCKKCIDDGGFCKACAHAEQLREAKRRELLGKITTGDKIQEKGNGIHSQAANDAGRTLRAGIWRQATPGATQSAYAAGHGAGYPTPATP